jgi:hypothetical protein
MDKQMQSMRELHDKMLAARTPEERSELMAEQMKLMQGGMGPGMGMGMGGPGMQPGAAAGRQEAMPMGAPDAGTRMQDMEKRMEDDAVHDADDDGPHGARPRGQVTGTAP